MADAILLAWLFVFVIFRLSQGQASETVVFLYFVQAGQLIAGPASSWLQWVSFFNVRAFFLLFIKIAITPGL